MYVFIRRRHYFVYYVLTFHSIPWNIEVTNDLVCYQPVNYVTDNVSRRGGDEPFSCWSQVKK